MKKTYKVADKFYQWDTVRYMYVQATNKAEAYYRAVWEKIPNAYKGDFPYSAWVESVKYANGRVHKFNTSEGNAY